MFGIELGKESDIFSKFPYASFGSLNILSLKSKNYLKCVNHNLLDTVTQLLPDHVKQEPYKVFMITQLSHLGFCYNPISIFVVTDVYGQFIKAILLEVHNTPWGERHNYLLDNLKHEQERYTQRFSKQLHVSPFMAMDYIYHFCMDIQEQKSILTLSNYRDDKSHFEAGVELEWYAATSKNLNKLIWHSPLSPYKTISAIYWQAMKLWLKRVRIYPHPKKD